MFVGHLCKLCYCHVLFAKYYHNYFVNVSPLLWPCYSLTLTLSVHGHDHGHGYRNSRHSVDMLTQKFKISPDRLREPAKTMAEHDVSHIG